MLHAIRSLTKVVGPVVEAQVAKMVGSTSRAFSSQRVVQSEITSASRPTLMSLSTISRRKYCNRMVEPPKQTSWVTTLWNQLLDTSSVSMAKIFPRINQPKELRVIAGLNRFGPLQSVNPFFMWNLQSIHRPYVTMGVSLLASLLYISSLFGTPDSTMRLAAVPVRYWSGDYLRLLTSPFLHTHAYHLLPASGFFLAFSTAVEVAAGPFALLAVLLSTAIVAGAVSIAMPDRNPNLYLERTQMGLWPIALGLSAFSFFGLRPTAPTYVMKNPNLTRDQKLWARQLTSTLNKRRLPLMVMAVMGMIPFFDLETTTSGGIAGAATGAYLGWLWTRSPHLVLINGALLSVGAAYLALEPTWKLQFQAFKFATAWEQGEFLRAREWMHLFDSSVRRLAPSDPTMQTESSNIVLYQQDWIAVMMALVEMACGRTHVAVTYADSVELNHLVLKSDLAALRMQLDKEWHQVKQGQDQKIPETNLTFGQRASFIPISKLPSFPLYQQALMAAPWRILNDEKAGALFYRAFIANPNASPSSMQNLIMLNYKGMFNLDPSYDRQQLPTQTTPASLPKEVRDNPLP